MSERDKAGTCSYRNVKGPIQKKLSKLEDRKDERPDRSKSGRIALVVGWQAANKSAQVD